MESAWVRDGVTGKRLSDSEVPFRRLPAVREFIWWRTIAYVVTGVHHAWGIDRMPVVTIDVATNAHASPEGANAGS